MAPRQVDPARELRRSLARIPLDEGTRVICDLHLDPAGGSRVEAFASWLDGLRAQRLVILGDLFEVWVGPAQAGLVGSRAILEALARATARGTAIDVIPGNRDFLLGRRFERESGARLRPGGLLAEHEAGDVLFVHGDELCTLDLAYQRMKRVLRSRPVTALATRAPLVAARWAAGRIRRASVRDVPLKSAEEKSMQREAVRVVAEVSGASTVVCGHAHEFRDSEVPGGCRWIVLDAWEGERDSLAVGAGGELRALSHLDDQGGDG